MVMNFDALSRRKDPRNRLNGVLKQIVVNARNERNGIETKKLDIQSELCSCELEFDGDEIIGHRD